MHIDIQARNYSADDKTRDIITKKLEKLSKLVDKDAKLKVLLKSTKDTCTMELTLVLGGTILRSEVSGADMRENLDAAVPKLEKQIKKFNERHNSIIKRERAKAHMDEDEFVGTVVKTKSFDIYAKSVDEAIDELEMVGHSFYVFRNIDTQKVNVVYRRNDGDYGVIEVNN